MRDEDYDCAMEAVAYKHHTTALLKDFEKVTKPGQARLGLGLGLGLELALWLGLGVGYGWG